MRPFIVFLFVAAVLSLVCQPLALARSSDPFEGTKWQITVTPEDGAAKGFQDTISFQGGKFISKEMEKRGFQQSSYEEDTRGRTTGAFTAVAKNDKQGTMKWTGSVTGPTIRGDLEWTKPDGNSVRYSFSGERQG